MLVLRILTGKGRWYYAIIINIAEAIALETNQKPLETHLGKKKRLHTSHFLTLFWSFQPLGVLHVHGMVETLNSKLCFLLLMYALLFMYALVAYIL